ncbi:MAG: hypothetical protein SPLUMA2_SPLUMAMAG2_01828 [uncultured Sulfurimonas sp.]|nr:MAG: hypothetical protein SPLUMA1_SPLUMAMAG1_00177 [uncultured Sulfurimonas sp.]CAI6152038.1 MAG: hypothetical protein SPLUMA2_SPLUMAMAG2_01828 [uncultured Sulfurimonas sp.]
MTNLQEDFRSELKSKDKLTVAGYAELYKKHAKMAVEAELNNGANKHQAEAMGNYYTAAVLTNCVPNENTLVRVLALIEDNKE